MAGKNTAVFGIYRSRVTVENAVDRLRQENFRNTDISVLFPKNEGTKDFAHEKSTKAPEGTAAGATSGAVIGGGLGWLAGRVCPKKSCPPAAGRPLYHGAIPFDRRRKPPWPGHRSPPRCGKSAGSPATPTAPP